MGDKTHPTHFQVPEMPWKKDNNINIYDEVPKEITKEDWSKLLERLHKMKTMTESLFATLDFYGLLFKCPKCGTYHSEDHKCFNCGFDHTAQD